MVSLIWLWFILAKQREPTLLQSLHWWHWTANSPNWSLHRAQQREPSPLAFRFMLLIRSCSLLQNCTLNHNWFKRHFWTQMMLHILWIHWSSHQIRYLRDSFFFTSFNFLWSFEYFNYTLLFMLTYLTTCSCGGSTFYTPAYV